MNRHSRVTPTFQSASWPVGKPALRKHSGSWSQSPVPGRAELLLSPDIWAARQRRPTILLFENPPGVGTGPTANGNSRRSLYAVCPHATGLLSLCLTTAFG